MAAETSTEPSWVRTQLSALPDPLWETPGADLGPRSEGPVAVTGLRRALQGLALVGVAAGLLGFGLLLTGGPLAPRGLSAALALAVGWGLVAGGLVAWSRRPDSRFGALMAGSGFAWLAAMLQGAGSGLANAVGLLAGGLWYGAFVHTLLAFPPRRPWAKGTRALMAAAYAVPVAAQLAAVLSGAVSTCPDCPALAGLEPAGLASALGGPGSAGVGLITAAVLVRRWRRATVAGRRSLAPLLWTGVAALVLVAAAAVAGDSPTTLAGWGPLTWLALAGLASVPLAFLAGLLRSRYFRPSAVAELVERLTETPRPGRLRQALADALGDPSLTLAYWLPESRRYVDAQGRPVQLPADDSGRRWTPVERDGSPVAAIVHDPSLHNEPELIRGAGAVAALALQNEQLEASLRARVDELQDSRTRLVKAADQERRRLERDLHDGAQQRLVGLALRLQLAVSKLPADPEAAGELLGQTSDELRQAIEELRELAHGIHPGVLTDHGLRPALTELSERAPLDVSLDVPIRERIEAPVEAAAYFVVAEALTNVAKYARATRTEVVVHRVDQRVVVEVRDDGIGGADLSGGSGLRGLWDRVGALDGRIEVVSPSGEGTLVRAEIPLSARPSAADEA